MPIYEYLCDRCERTVEVLVRSISEQPQCPDCGGDQLHKEWSLPASPAVRGGGLPVSRGDSGGEACGMPRCCGGGCQ
jgi:putative FmdB family regulatory protein